MMVYLVGKESVEVSRELFLSQKPDYSRLERTDSMSTQYVYIMTAGFISSYIGDYSFLPYKLHGASRHSVETYCTSIFSIGNTDDRIQLKTSIVKSLNNNKSEIVDIANDNLFYFIPMGSLDTPEMMYLYKPYMENKVEIGRMYHSGEWFSPIGLQGLKIVHSGGYSIRTKPHPILRSDIGKLLSTFPRTSPIWSSVSLFSSSFDLMELTRGDASPMTFAKYVKSRILRHFCYLKGTDISLPVCIIIDRNGIHGLESEEDDGLNRYLKENAEEPIAALSDDLYI